MTEIRSVSNLKAMTGDLSIGGCFLHLPTPLPVGTQIQVNISQGNTAFTALGRVAFVRPNLGMGVMFTRVEPDHREILTGWVTELSDCTHAFQSKYERLYGGYRGGTRGYAPGFRLLVLLAFACLLVFVWGLFAKW